MTALRAWIELARLSNLPTVWSNVIAGAAIAQVPIHQLVSIAPRVAIAAAALSLIYTAGMILNDVFDAEIDSRERPSRPIPSGRVSRAAAGVVGVMLLLAGLGLTAALGVIPAALAGALVVLVLLYNAVHTLGPWATVLMGLCRGLVIVLACAACTTNTDLLRGAILPAALLAIFVVVLSLAARSEVDVDTPDRARRDQRVAFFTLGGLALAGLGVLLLPFARSTPAFMLAPVPLLLWLLSLAHRATRMSLPRHALILGAIAGIALLDAAIVLASGGAWSMLGVGLCLACFVLTRIMHARIPGT